MENKTDIDKNGALAEYNSLRQEVVALSTRRTQRLAITMAALPTLISIGFVSNLPEITALALIVVSSGWRDDHQVRQATHRIGAYIKFFLEPILSGVNWETVLSTSVQPARASNVCDSCKKSSSGNLRNLKNTLRYTYGVIALISIIATLGSAVIVFLTPYTPELNPIGSLMQISKSDDTVLLIRVIIFSLITFFGIADIKKAIAEGMKTHETLHIIHASMESKAKLNLTT